MAPPHKWVRIWVQNFVYQLVESVNLEVSLVLDSVINHPKSANTNGTLLEVIKVEKNQ